MLTRRTYIPPTRLIDIVEDDPKDWRTAYKKQIERTRRLENHINGFQNSVKQFFDWLNKPGALVNQSVSGTYTPTLSNFFNMSSATPKISTYIHIGDVVFVSGQASITSSAAGTTTQFSITLPVSATIPTGEAGGTVGSFYSVTAGGPIYDNGTTVLAQYTATSTNAETVGWTFSYSTV